jgi:hypothetical protein
MAFVNYSISEDLKKAFNDAFRGRNKSAIIAELMRDAIDAEHAHKRSVKSIDELLKRRATSPFVENDDEDTHQRRRRR